MKNKLTYKECEIESLKYNRRYDLELNNRSIYRYIKKNGWEELFSHMETKYLTYDKCKNISIQYKTRVELIKNNCSVYNKIIKNNWKDLFSHMVSVGDKYKRMIYSYEFSDGYCYVGLTYDINKRNKQHLNINSKKRSPVIKHILLTGLKPSLMKKTEYIEVELAKKMETEILNDYLNKGWIVLNKIKAGGIGGFSKWTYDKCEKEALKFKTRSEIKLNSPSVYNVINKNQWYELYSHMIMKVKNWTLDEVLDISKNYRKISHFHKEYSGAYKIAERNGWLPEIRYIINNNDK